MREHRTTSPTIRSKLIKVYGGIALILLLAFASFYTLSHTRRELIEMRLYGASLQDQTLSYLSSELGMQQLTLRIIHNNALFQAFIEDPPEETDDNGLMVIRGRNELYEEIMHVINVSGDLATAGIYLAQNDEIYLFGGIGHEERVSQMYIEHIRSLWDRVQTGETLYSVTGPVYCTSDEQMVICQRAILTRNMETVGILFLNYNQSTMEKLLRESPAGSIGDVFLTMEDTYAAGTDQALYDSWRVDESAFRHTIFGTQVCRIEGKDYVVVEKDSQDYGWHMTTLLPLDGLYSELLQTYRLIAAAALLAVIALLLVTIRTSGRISRPIEELDRAMRQISGSRDMHVSYEDHTFLETEELGASFTKMISDIDELIIRNQEAQIREKEAQISVLQSQINPHFLFNTLNTINYMLVIEDQTEISELVVALGDLLRAGLEGVGHIITVKEETELVEKYLAIQRARFGEELAYEIDLTPEAAQCYMIALVLQPIVENAILHGFEESGGTGHLVIRGFVQETEQRLILEVTDDGCGMTGAQVEQLLLAEEQSTKKRRHIGVRNVHERLRLTYGDAYGVEVESTPGIGTVVRLIMPVCLDN